MCSLCRREIRSSDSALFMRAPEDRISFYVNNTLKCCLKRLIIFEGISFVRLQLPLSQIDPGLKLSQI